MQIAKYKKDTLNFFEKKFSRLEKRLRFVISSLIMSGVLLFSTFFLFDRAWIFIPILMALSYVLTYFSLLEDIEKIEWLLLYLIPVLLTVAFYLFYFLFPGRWLTRLPFISFYAISFYAVLLCSNIFNVGVEKNLPLYRAAFSVNFFYQTIIAFLFFNYFLSLKLNFVATSFLSGVVSFALSRQLLWSVKLDLELDQIDTRYAFIIACVIAQLAAIFSFLPQISTVLALFLSASYYSLTGLIYHFRDSSLFKETIREYLVVWGFVFAIIILTISW